MTAQPLNAMAKITAAIHARNAQKTGASTVFYQYQQVPPGTSLIARPLPVRGGSLAELPWQDAYQHKFTTQGIRNSDHDNDDEYSVMFLGMATWGLPDPINLDIKPLWDTDRDLARQFYHTRLTYIPVEIVSSPLVEKIQNPPRARVIKSGPQLVKALESALLNGGFDYPPWDWDHGRDAVIPVSLQGGFRHYSASFRGKERPIAEADRIPDDELPDLTALIGPAPTDEVLELQWQLYLDCRNGEPFDNAKFGRHFKAYSNRPTNGNAPAAPAPQISEAHRQEATDKLAELRQKTRSTRPTDDTTPTD
jgi:hypothetical protein